MFGLPWNVWAAIIGSLAFAAWQFWPSISKLKLPFGGKTKTVDSDDEDVADFKALRRLRARFERLKCKDGLEACATCLANFDHVGRT